MNRAHPIHRFRSRAQSLDHFAQPVERRVWSSETPFSLSRAHPPIPPRGRAQERRRGFARARGRANGRATSDGLGTSRGGSPLLPRWEQPPLETEFVLPDRVRKVVYEYGVDVLSRPIRCDVVLMLHVGFLKSTFCLVRCLRWEKHSWQFGMVGAGRWMRLLGPAFAVM